MITNRPCEKIGLLPCSSKFNYRCTLIKDHIYKLLQKIYGFDNVYREVYIPFDLHISEYQEDKYRSLRSIYHLLYNDAKNKWDKNLNDFSL